LKLSYGQFGVAKGDIISPQKINRLRKVTGSHL